MTVAEAFKQEQGSLMPLPDNPYAVFESTVVSVGKAPYVRYDLNDYSVPHEHVQKQLTVQADSNWVRILDGLKEVAKHKRCFEKRRQIETTEHISRLVEEKKKAKKGSGMNRLFCSAPTARKMFRMAAERGYSIGSLTSKLLRLLDLYGPAEVRSQSRKW